MIPLDELMNATPDAEKMAQIKQTLTTTPATPSRSRQWLVAATVLLALAAGFLGGRFTAPGESGDPGDGPTVSTGADRYLITLHEDAAFSAPPMAEAVMEYNEWGSDLAARGLFVSAEKLEDIQPTVLGAAPADGAVMTGFYIIRAPSEAEALAIAQTMPHLKYGGSVKVHPVEDLSKYVQ